MESLGDGLIGYFTITSIELAMMSPFTAIDLHEIPRRIRITA